MPTKTKALSALVALLCAAPMAARADVKPNALFSDHVVLQREKPVPMWGSADEGEKVTVEFGGQKVSTVAKDGVWKVELKPLKANAVGQKLTISGKNTVVLDDVLVGEVWICSGQSNMEWQLGGGIENWRAEADAANFPLLRQFTVAKKIATRPQSEVGGSWAVCSPQTAPSFSAVAFFFGRDLQQALKVPVGLVVSAWGGTVAEAWTSGPSLQTMPDFAPAVQRVEASATELQPEAYDKALAEFWLKNEPGSAPGQSWAAPDFAAANWKPVKGSLEASGGDFDGVFWMRREFDVPAENAGKAAVLHLGAIDDNDTTFLNGVPIGATEGWQTARNYKIPANLLKAGRNVVAIRALDTGGGGGFSGDASVQKLEIAGGPAIALGENWTFQTSTPLNQLGAMPRRANPNPNTATVLYNGMIAPLVPVAFRGVIWYQGESNNGRATQYQTLFPLLIADWRQQFGQGDFPFLFVQLAPFNSMSPEIREAQFLTLQKSPNTAMAVITDAGNAGDIHPRKKQPVGARLALAARALAYGEKIEYSGPLYQNFKVEGNRVVLNFSGVGGGLVAKDGPLKGFEIAGNDGKFVAADAQIVGKTVVVSSDHVPNPSAARYGWATVPDVNLFNVEGLPASPFRTDL